MIEDYDVLGRPPEADLQSLVELAAYICQVPTAIIHLITATEQHAVAAYGADSGQVARENSLCSTALLADRPVVVRDARRDARFADNPYVTGTLGQIRFYAANQLRTPDGVVVGTLCVYDQTERRLSPAQARALDALARQVIDVLELRRRSIDLQRALAELERSNGALSAFAGQVSHDLRNPLAAVTSCLETLADIDVVAGDAEAMQFVGLGRRAGAGMHQLLDRLLTYARIDGRLDRADVDLAPLVRQVLETLRPLLERTGAQVEVGQLPAVSADEVQLRAVVENLLTNAVKFRAPDRPARVRVAAEPAASGWRIEVADNGIGIPAESRQDVFGVFRRLTSSRGVDGFGLGLSTCRRVVEAHGGEIGVDETAGGGTTIWFTLPEEA